MHNHSTIVIRERGGKFYTRFKYWEVGTDGNNRHETSLWADDKIGVQRKVNTFLGYEKYKNVAETTESATENDKTVTDL